MIERNEADLEAAGHWAAPTFVFNGEPIFGQGPVGLLVCRLHQRGLRRCDGAAAAAAAAAGAA